MLRTHLWQVPQWWHLNSWMVTFLVWSCGRANNNVSSDSGFPRQRSPSRWELDQGLRWWTWSYSTGAWRRGCGKRPAIRCMVGAWDGACTRPRTRSSWKIWTGPLPRSEASTSSCSLFPGCSCCWLIVILNIPYYILSTFFPNARPLFPLIHSSHSSFPASNYSPCSS